MQVLRKFLQVNIDRCRTAAQENFIVFGYSEIILETDQHLTGARNGHDFTTIDAYGTFALPGRFRCMTKVQQNAY